MPTFLRRPRYIRLNDAKYSLENSHLFSLSFPVDAGYERSAESNTQDNRVLVILEHVLSEDLSNSRLSVTSSVADSLLAAGAKWAEANCRTEQDAEAVQSVKDAYFGFINFNFIKTYHLRGQAYGSALQASARRVLAFIRKTRPSHILIFGDQAAQALLSDYVQDIDYKRGWVHEIELFDGYVPKIVHTIDSMPVIDIIERLEEDRASDEKLPIDRANLAGLISRHIGSLFMERLPYSIAKVKPKAVVISTLEQFDAMMVDINNARAVSFDLETASLDVYNNAIRTAQFATKTSYGYVLPLTHKDSPFTATELDYIHKNLRAFFAQKLPFDPSDDGFRYLVGQNLKFDCRVVRQYFRIPHIYWPLWDCIAGEYLHDENLKALGAYNKGSRDFGFYHKEGKVYSLDRLCGYYGNAYYVEASFSKEQRATISHVDLDDFKNYAAFDVQSTLAIHKMQRLRAKYRPFVGEQNYEPIYTRFVLAQMSMTIHVMSIMEERGVRVDVNYLMSLLSDDSLLDAREREIEAAVASNENILKANQLLAKKHGIPSTDLFGTASNWVFKFSKPEHRNMLYFTVMGLEPVTYGKTGPSTGKPFQTEYASVPEVSVFREWQQLKKIRTSYAEPFLTHLTKSHDGQIDQRIHPGFDYQSVVTGRSNSFKPSLQQTPEHSGNAKLIKRVFVASPGKLTIKMDYCITGDALIPTEHGLIRLDELYHGQCEINEPVPIKIKMAGESSSGTSVAVYWIYRGEKPTVRVTTELGNSVTCTPEHKLRVLRNSQLTWVAAQDCIAGDLLCIAKKPMVRSEPLPLAFSSTNLPSTMTPDIAYTLGYLIGEPSNYGLRCTRGRQVFYLAERGTDKLQQYLLTVFGVKPDYLMPNYGLMYASSELANWLGYLGLTEHPTQLPWCILQADHESQIAFLSGVFDVNGYVKNKTMLVWSVKNDTFARQLHVLLNSHGYLARSTPLGSRCDISLNSEDSTHLWYSLSLYITSQWVLNQAGNLETKNNPSASYSKSMYRFTPVVSVTSDKTQPVYDLSMRKCDVPLFIANGLAVSNCAHEVRCWGILAQDEAIAEAFEVGRQLRIQFRRDPHNEEIKRDLELKGDVHKVNYNFFTGTPLGEIDSEKRQASKAITFGSIYGQSPRTLAGKLKKSLQFVNKLLSRFFGKFYRAAAWLDWTQEFAQTNHFTFSPLGRVRNLHGYIYGYRGIDAALNRRAMNSPIQGAASDFGFMAAWIFQRLLTQTLLKLDLETGDDLFPVGINVMVHDSIEVEVPYEYFPIALHLMEYAATVGVRAVTKRLYNLDFVVDLEVDFDIGAFGDKMRKWDFTDDALKDLIRQAIEDQYANDPTWVRPYFDSKQPRSVNEAVRVVRQAFKAYKPYLNKKFPLNV